MAVQPEPSGNTAGADGDGTRGASLLAALDLPDRTATTAATSRGNADDRAGGGGGAFLQPSVALPLITGLVRAGSSASSRIVSTALDEREASRTITSFLRRRVAVALRQRRRRRRQTDGDWADREGSAPAGRSTSTSSTTSSSSRPTRASTSSRKSGEDWVFGGNETKRRRTAAKRRTDDTTDPEGSGSGERASDQTKANDDDAAPESAVAVPFTTTRTSSTSTSAPACPDLGISRRHWALQSLLCPSPRVRRAASRLLLDGTFAEAAGGTAASGSPASATHHNQHRLISALLDLAATDIVTTLDCSLHGRNGHGMEAGGDPAVQFVGLLSHLVTEEPALHALVASRSNSGSRGRNACSSGGGDGGRNTSSSTARGESSVSLLSSQSLEDVIATDYSIESFVASGGLRWASSCLLRLVAELTTRTSSEGAAASSQSGGGSGPHSPRDRTGGSVDGNDDVAVEVGVGVGGSNTITSHLLDDSSSGGMNSSPLLSCGGADETEIETLQTRVIVIVDLLYRLVLRATLTHCDYSAGCADEQLSSSVLVNVSGAAAASATENRTKAAELDKARQKRRQATLLRVHRLLWSSEVPALRVMSNSSGSDPSTSVPLSPLACIVASYQLLKAAYGTSSGGGSPFLTGRARGLERSIISLGRLVSVSSSIVVSPPSADTSNATRGTRSRQGGGGTSSSPAGHRPTAPPERRRKRVRTTISGREGDSLGRDAGGAQSDAAARRSAYGRSLASSLLFGSADALLGGVGSPGSSPSAIARSVSAAMSALDRTRSTYGTMNSLSEDNSRNRDAMDVDEEIDSDDEPFEEANVGNGDADSDGDDHDIQNRYDQETDDGGEEGKEIEGVDDDEIVSDDDDNGTCDHSASQDIESFAIDSSGERQDHMDMVDEPFDDSILVVEDECSGRLDPAATAANRAAAISGLTSPGRAKQQNPWPSTKENREKTYLKTGMTILKAQNPHQNYPTSHAPSASAATSSLVPCTIFPPVLTTAAEKSLLTSMCEIIRPPKKPVNLKMFLRRAPTQEEFFRGNLSRNPVSLSHLLAQSQNASSRPTVAGVTSVSTPGDAQTDDSKESTVRDLRDHIAKDLQMSDSAEMLELLVANKILDLNLKLRVVAQVLWKEHVLENATSAPTGSGASGGLGGLLSSGQHMIQAGGGLAMVFSTASVGQASGSTGSRPARAALASSLPPMVVTYRLIGVDGEATEDKVELGDLVDPEAPQDAAVDSDAYKERMEKEYGITHVVAEGRGINVLLRSVSCDLSLWLRRIRRDNVEGIIAGGRRMANPSREKFTRRTVHPALVLLQHCSRLSDNRKIMVKARAPTILLRLLLDVLNAIDEHVSSEKSSVAEFSAGAENGTDATSMDISNDDAVSTSNEIVESNCPTADALQGLIELLASDISVEADKVAANKKPLQGNRGNDDKTQDIFHEIATSNEDPEDDDDSTMPLLLSSLRSTSLSPPLRKIIAKLLPFLTYGQVHQSKALASQFIRYVNLDKLNADDCGASGRNEKYLMETFVSAAINLPAVAVCDPLRMELISQGFVDTVSRFVLTDVPSRPPPWSPALFGKSYMGDSSQFSETKESQLRERFERKWREYFWRPSLATALRILTSLVANHAPTQLLIANVVSEEVSEDFAADSPISLLKALHWIESTSDKTSSSICVKDLGLLSETLLDALQEENDNVKSQVSFLRKKTRERKKEIAKERRSRALVGMGSFGMAETSVASLTTNRNSSGTARASANVTGHTRLAASSAVALASSSSSNTRNEGQNAVASMTSDAKPTWLAEMEAMEDETGLTCAVCQEGTTLQPSELLGLYVYIKKVSIPHNKCGGQGDVDGALLLMSLPGLLPSSLRGAEMQREWYQPAISAAESLRSTSHGASTIAAAQAATSLTSPRPSHYTTTVSAGNAIHCTCHARARTADRNHPKAPKSEWEGASLRNSRVACNAILPLVSSRSSKVSLIAVEQGLAEHQTAIANMLGARPKSMLWHTLHDVRLLLLRMAHGEMLGADCGGGSLASNSSLLFYILSHS